jgi:hypothetical protein
MHVERFFINPTSSTIHYTLIQLFAYREREGEGGGGGERATPASLAYPPHL